MGICEQVLQDIGSVVSLCVCTPLFCCYFVRGETLSLVLQPWERQCCPWGWLMGQESWKPLRILILSGGRTEAMGESELILCTWSHTVRKSRQMALKWQNKSHRAQ